MNQYYPQEYYYYPEQYYQPQWVEVIAPILAGVVMLVFIMGMVRDLFKGKEIALP